MDTDQLQTGIIIVFLVLLMYCFWRHRQYKCRRAIEKAAQGTDKDNTKARYNDYDPTTDTHIKDISTRLKMLHSAKGAKPRKPTDIVSSFIGGAIRGAIGGMVMNPGATNVVRNSFFMGSLTGGMRYFL
jgi:hypothetical protein